MDDLETIIARAMQAQQKLQAAHNARASAVTATDLQRREFTVDDAIARVRCIPARFRGIVRTILQDGVPESLSTLALALDVEGSAVPFVTLVGKTGAGKTSMALALPVARLLLAHAGSSGRTEDPHPWRFMHADDLASCRKFSKLGEVPRAIEEGMERRPLIIDDIVGQKDVDGDLYAVLRHREENALPTVLTTGISREDVANIYGGMFARRLFAGAVHLIGTRR